MVKLHDSRRDKLESRNDQGFLSRWSQRKQAQQDVVTEPVVDSTELPADTQLDSLTTDATALAKAPAGEGSNDHQADVSTPLEDEESPAVVVDADQQENPEEEILLTDADMPPLENLQKDSDVSMFFNRGVSRELRKSALRKLFSLPALNITDGLNDYDEDYTTFEPLGDIITSDMKFHAERKARLAEEAEAEKRAALEAENDTEESEEAVAENSEDMPESDEDTEGQVDADGQTAAEENPELESEPTEAKPIEAESIEAENSELLASGSKVVSEPPSASTSQTGGPQAGMQQSPERG